MKQSLKPISQQTIVITGATSGIGLVTARMAVRRGARVVLAAREEDALKQLETELNAGADPDANEPKAVAVVADVSREEDVQQLAQAALSRFGGFDTWVNNAGTSVIGRVTEIPIADMRNLFDVNFWGTVYGSRAAARHLKGRGGAIINIGSVASDVAPPMEGTYAATKHAMKAFTDALRVELAADDIPISVTLIKPTGIATPFFEHVKNTTDVLPEKPKPLFAPELVAEAILYAAENPTRDLLVGDTAPLQSAIGRVAPGLGDKFMKARAKGHRSANPPQPGPHQGLDEPTSELRERGDYDVTVVEISPYTKAQMHPVLTGAILAGAGLLGGAWLVRRATCRTNS